MRRFAQDTSVSVGRSRAEIDDLLRSWGCGGLQWLDDFEEGRAELQFKWRRDEVLYVARFDIKLPDDKALREKARWGGTGGFLPEKFKKLQEGRGRQEHRLLLLWLKAALNAVDAGIIDPAVIFLPFLIGKNGQTVAEVALPRLPELLTHDANRLLTSGN